MHQRCFVLLACALLTACAVASPTESAARPDPIVLEGSGQWEGKDMHLPWPRAIAHITYTGSGAFLVGMFQNAEYEILVNQIGPFDGMRPIGNDGSVMFDVFTDGPWTITLLPDE